MDRLKGGGQVIKVGIKRARTIAHSVDYFLLKDVFYVIVVLALFFRSLWRMASLKFHFCDFVYKVESGKRKSPVVKY